MSEKAQPPRRVLRIVRDHPWAMLRSAHEAMLQVIELRMSGVRRSEEEIRAAVEAVARPQTVAMSAPGSIAILPLTGIIAQRMDMFIEISGGTSTERFGATFRQVMADPTVTAIIFDVDSPGGSVFGVQELADLIYNARGEKPIIAVVNSMACSAAYWIASQADEMVVTPSGEVGSIGVICMHENLAAMNELLGIDVTYLTYPEDGYKSEGNMHEPLSEDARAYILGRLAEYGQPFEAGVARGRGVKVAKVQKEFGRGRVVGAKMAVSLGMADRIGTLQETIDRLAKKKAKGGVRAEASQGANGAYFDTTAGEMRTYERPENEAPILQSQQPGPVLAEVTAETPLTVAEAYAAGRALAEGTEGRLTPGGERLLSSLSERAAETDAAAPDTAEVAVEAAALATKAAAIPEPPPPSVDDAARQLALAKLRLAGAGR